MPTFSARSKEKLLQCHPELQRIMNKAIEVYDFTVLCGYRGKKEQDEAFEKGTSMLKYPRSKHNRMPALAVDIAPYPIDWNNIDRFIQLGHIVEDIGYGMGIPLIWGGRWAHFKDYPHYELGNNRLEL